MDNGIVPTDDDEGGVRMNDLSRESRSWGRVTKPDKVPRQRQVTAKLVADDDITLSGSQTLDGVAISDGDIVLVSGQSDDTENGPYTASTSGDWARVRTITAGMICTVTDGVEYANTVWMLDQQGKVILDTTSQSWSLVNPAARWSPRVFTATPPSTTTITCDVTGMVVGMPIRYKISGTYRYALISAIGSGVITVLGESLSGTITGLWVGSPELVVQADLYVPGLYAVSTGNILVSLAKTYFTWKFSAAWLVNFTAWSNTGGAGTAKINIKIGSTSVDTNGVVPSTSGVSSAAIANPSIVFGNSVEIDVTVSDASASDLTVACIFILA